jgi:hypothetical protein
MQQEHTPLENLQDEIHNTLSEMENSDESMKVLEKAMNYFCGTWDICEGFKHAIMETVDDQVNNHGNEQQQSDFKRLLDILNNAI